MGLKLRLKEEYFLMLFIILGLFFYLNISKLPLDHPGNIKAADPFYHTVSVESILDTKQWSYYAYYLSLGNDKVVSHQPPLVYTAAAMLTEFTGLPAWVTLYFLVCVSQALFIVIVYLITLEAFENKKIALLASGLTILPLPLGYWLYGVYIGFWLQVPSYFFIMAIVWLTMKYLKTKKDYLLLAMGFCVSAVLLLHLADVMIVLFELLFVAFVILIDFFKKKDFISLMKKGLLWCLFPTISFITVLPRILYVWSGLGTNMFTPGFYGMRDAFPKEQYGGFVWPPFEFFPLYVRIIFILGMVILSAIAAFYILGLFSKKFGMPFVKSDKGKAVIKMKKEPVHFSYFLIFLFVALYFATVYLSPVFFSDPYYLGGRARSLQPFFVYPVMAFAIWLVIKIIEEFSLQEKNKNHVFELAFILAIVFIMIIVSLGEYNQMTDQMTGEILSSQKWSAYKWIQDNTAKDATLLFFGGIYQGENVYTKRISAVMDINDLNAYIQNYSATNKTPEIIHTAGWGGNTIREGGWKIEKSFLDYIDYSELNSTVNVSFFNYLVFQNFAQQMVNINLFFANEYVKKGYKPVYNDGTTIILQNEKQ